MSADTGLELPASPPDAGARRRSGTWRSAFATPSGIVGIVLMAGVLVLVAMAVLGLTPASPRAQDVSQGLLGPSGTHWFGTDQFGRDVFSRVASGLANSMRVAVASVAVSGVVGITLGVVAGYYQGSPTGSSASSTTSCSPSPRCCSPSPSPPPWSAAGSP